MKRYWLAIAFIIGILVGWIIHTPTKDTKISTSKDNYQNPTRITVAYPDAKMPLGHRFRSLTPQYQDVGSPHEITEEEWSITLLFDIPMNESRSIIYIAK